MKVLGQSRAISVLRQRAELCCCVGMLLSLCGCATRSEPVAHRVDFHRDIAPIFQVRCGGCHGANNRQGGLRLDVKEFALKGGLSGKPFLNSSASEGELLRRIMTDDPTLVMPKEGGRLPNREVDLIRRWLTAVAPWPEIEPIAEADQFANRYQADVLDRLSVVGRELKPLYLMLFALLLGAADRIRRTNPEHPRWSSGVGRTIWRASQHVSAAWFAVALLTVLIWDIVGFSSRQAAQLAATQRKLSRAMAADRAVPDALQGAAPKPLKPRNAPQLGGMYYRGNDERDERLFNGGDYRTATLRLALVDEHEQPLQLGQQLPGRQLFIRLEIERAPFTTPSLFTDDMIRSVLLSRRTAETKQAMPEDEPAGLETLEPGERWAARYRLKEYDGQTDAAIDGLLYVSSGTRVGEAVQGTIHYGIVFSLRIAAATLRDNSALWMGPIVVPANFHAVEPGKITLPEWLDTQPIPEITGPNTTDPKLLGIPEHAPRP